MAAPAVNSTTTRTSTGISSDSFNVTVGSGLSNSMLFVFTNNRDTGVAVSSITFDGVALTAALSAVDFYQVGIHYLVTPNVGTLSLAITWAATVNSATTTVILVTGASGVETAVKTRSAGTAVSYEIVTTVGDELVLNSVFATFPVSAHGTNQTELSNFNSGAFYQATSWKAQTTPATVTMSETISGSSDWMEAIIAVKPALNAGGMFLAF